MIVIGTKRNTKVK